MKPLITLRKDKEPYYYDCLNDRLLKEDEDVVVVYTAIPLVGIKNPGSRITDLDEFPHYLDEGLEENTMPQNFIKEPIGWYRVYHSNGCGKVAFYYKVKPVAGEIIFQSNIMLLDGSAQDDKPIICCPHCKEPITFTGDYITDATLIEEQKLEFNMPVENRYEGEEDLKKT